ncbi:DNA polymerase kappa, POLK [Carpediemonas membranifera]|uniref:DNA polymerase kappa n=1 Tax=Carpediemonas membranifera TaxID=201153 RepID=A0A8J6E076_9EUKA|nr:DNA polymerase kappa, POLK [Carpediemonas membranifera]|eukprot:KAG9391778.1 DNA polymerase kappa, POLK [Carpediemonas membranifera]
MFGLREKAGMSQAVISKEDAERIIYEASKDSPFFKAQQRKEEELKARCAHVVRRAESLLPVEKSGAIRHAEREVKSLLSTLAKDVKGARCFIHIDMDAFFVQVEERDNPSLRGKPVVVGHPRSIISTSNYEARKYHVRSAMAGFIAKKLCPDLIFCELRMKAYAEVSRLSEQAYAAVDPGYEMHSLDEASLDATEYLARHPEMTADDVCEQIRAKVFELTQLTCSAGSGLSRLAAKIASDMRKPNGQFPIGRSVHAHVSFFDGLPLKKITGVGQVTERILAALGLVTCKDVRDQPHQLAVLPLASRDGLLRLSLGIDRPRQPVHRHSMGVERTVSATVNKESVWAFVEGLAGQLKSRLDAAGVAGETMCFKWKDDKFRSFTRQERMPQQTADRDKLLDAANRLLGKVLAETDNFTARLIGLQVTLGASCAEGERLKSTLVAQAGGVACPCCGRRFASEHDVDGHIEMSGCGLEKKPRTRAKAKAKAPKAKTKTELKERPVKRVGRAKRGQTSLKDFAPKTYNID